MESKEIRELLHKPKLTVAQKRKMLKEIELIESNIDMVEMVERAKVASRKMQMTFQERFRPFDI